MAYVAAHPLHLEGGVLGVGDPMPEDFPLWPTFGALIDAHAVTWTTDAVDERPAVPQPKAKHAALKPVTVPDDEPPLTLPED